MDYTRLPEKYRIYLKELRNPENPIIKEISEIFVKYQPDIVGVTVMTPKAASAFTIASLAKKIQQKLLCCLWRSPCGFEGGGDPQKHERR